MPQMDGVKVSEGSATGEQIEDQRDDGEDDEDVNPAGEGVATDKADQPEKEKDYCDSPEHLKLLIARP